MQAHRLPCLAVLAAGAIAAAGPARADAPTHQRFTLYKFQNPIGVEEAIDDGRELRVTFSFTDRWQTVPLSAVLERGKDGAPVHFQLWGHTSRPFDADDRVDVAAGKLTITQRGVARTVAAPPRFFTASAYAPVSITQELLRYWAAHGKPASLPVYPIGELAIARRGEDTVTDDDGKSRTLERFSIAGLGWGRETVWLDDKHQLAVMKGVDTEFDHFEAVGRGFGHALPQLIARAAEDGLAALAEVARTTRVETGDGATAYVHGRLVDGSNAPPVADATVVVDHGKIVAAGPSAKVRIPDGARTIDATGTTIVPGLWDMHAHVEQVEWGPVYLAAGVTTVRDCANELPFIRAVRDTIAAGQGVGPRVLMACVVDGESGGALGIDRLRTADQIPALIKKFKDAGCAQVKIYQSFPPALIHPLSVAAHAAGMTVTGHVPNGIGVVAAVDAGQDQVNHLPFVLEAFLGKLPERDMQARDRALATLDLASPASKKLAAWFAARHVVLDPTLSVYELSLPRAVLLQREPGLGKLPPALQPVFADPGPRPDDDTRTRRFARFVELLGVLHKAGVTIVAGTDQTVPGHSLHGEIELYVEAGFTPLEALQAATIVPARAMKRDRELGTVEVGKRADFLLVDGDPLADIRALRKLKLVVAEGKAYDPAKLWRSVDFTP
ncbi:MAG TPA: amidohydrolase family protein [Kofleriaceae bacterium]|nr:amidohydrolase family protein [Kofleriaceae bacterium]